MSSFSDYNNCVGQKKLQEELLKNLYFFVSKFFNLLLKKIPHLFYSQLIWRIVIGENYYSESILDYFKNSDFIHTIFSEEKLNPKIIQKSTSDTLLKSQNSKKPKIFNLKNLNKFYNQYIQKLIQNEDSLVLLFHTTPNLFIKYFLLELFQNLLKHIPLNNLNLKKNNLHKFDNIGIQVK